MSGVSVCIVVSIGFPEVEKWCGVVWLMRFVRDVTAIFAPSPIPEARDIRSNKRAYIAHNATSP